MNSPPEIAARGLSATQGVWNRRDAEHAKKMEDFRSEI